MTQVNFWLKNWPWSRYNKAVERIHQLRRADDWAGLARHFVVAKAIGDIQYAAYTPEFMEDAVRRIFLQDDLSDGFQFLRVVLNSDAHREACKETILDICADNIDETEYETVRDTVNLIKGLRKGFTAQIADEILTGIAEKLIDDSLGIAHEEAAAAEDRKAILASLRDSIPAQVSAVLCQRINPDWDEFYIDDAINALDHANQYDLLSLIPASNMQQLLDFCLTEGLPESAYSVCWFVENGGQSHLKDVAPSATDYALVPFAVNKEDNLTLLFRFHAEGTDDAVVVENGDDYNIGVIEMMDRIRDERFYYSAELDQTTDGTLNDLAALFTRLARQEDAPFDVAQDLATTAAFYVNDLPSLFGRLAQQSEAVATVAQRILPEMVQWFAANGKPFPDMTPEA